MDIIFKEYCQIVWQKKWSFLLVVCALFSATALDLYVPVLFKNIANGLAQPYTVAIREVIIDNLKNVALLYAAIWISWRLLEVGIIPLEGGGINLLEKRCFAVLKQQKYVFFENNFSGSLIKQSNRFSRSFETIMDWFLFQFFQNIIAVSVSFFIFYTQQPVFAWYFLIWVCAFLFWSIAYSIWKLRFDKAVALWDSKVGGAYSDAISNIFIVKSFALENHEQSQIDAAADQVYRKKRIAWALMFVSFAIQGLMVFGLQLLFIYLMIGKWQEGRFEVGEFVLFQAILLMLIERLWEFGRNFRNFFTALADASEMADVFRQHDLEVDQPHTRALSIRQGQVDFNNIRFSYTGIHENAKPLFDNFSLHIRAGEKVALVGPSGGGKTSLTKLLFRFVEPVQGQLLFDRQNSLDFTLTSLREQISLIPQQPELFHRTVRENITLGREISTEQLEAVAKQARCMDFINHLSDQFETLVGERGIKLSGGEKQRIAIARALLEDSPIVVLDEATSALDSLTEKQIQAAIFSLIKDKTAIVIAHRLSTILSMDRIIVMDHGRIIEQGTHQQLLQNQGKYYAMWQHQSGEFLGDN